mgnify:CR=1 FL=1
MSTPEKLTQEELEKKLAGQFAEFVQLVGGLAHEIKNPLSTIRLNLELLGEDLSDPQTPNERRAAGKVEVVERECTRLQRLLDDFLQFARVRPAELAPHSVNDSLHRVLDFFQPQADSSRMADNSWSGQGAHPKVWLSILSTMGSAWIPQRSTARSTRFIPLKVEAAVSGYQQREKSSKPTAGRFPCKVNWSEARNLQLNFRHHAESQKNRRPEKTVVR